MNIGKQKHVGVQVAVNCDPVPGAVSAPGEITHFACPAPGDLQHKWSLFPQLESVLHRAGRHMLAKEDVDIGFLHTKKGPTSPFFFNPRII
jgi:hypothetical protein